jgi:hypothetical protein
MILFTGVMSRKWKRTYLISPRHVLRVRRSCRSFCPSNDPSGGACRAYRLVPGKLRNEVHGAGILHVSGVGLAEIDEVSSKLRAGVATIDLSFCLGAGRLTSPILNLGNFFEQLDGLCVEQEDDVKVKCAPDFVISSTNAALNAWMARSGAAADPDPFGLTVSVCTADG